MAGSTESKRAELTGRLLALLIMLPVLAWIAYFWERTTGLTFVLSKHVEIGNLANAQHLASTLNHAIGATVICVPLAIILYGLRRRPEA